MQLPRFQLFEFEDLPWFPRKIRDLATDYLHFMETRFALHKPIAPILKTALQQAGSASVVDLCSGGGGPVLALYESLRAEQPHLRVTLTDKFPNLDAFTRIAALHPDSIGYVPDPVDATDVPRDLVGFRTMFNAFHHFAPDAARQVLANAVETGQPIGIFEIPERSLTAILAFFLTPLFVAVATPFIRPFRWDRLLWTYCIPLVPLTCWWDGLASAFRAYTVDEMLALASPLRPFGWKCDRIHIPGSAAHLTYLIGAPLQRPSQA